MCAVAGISTFLPTIISSGIFSSRRINSGVDAVNASNPFVGAMNCDIAAGQILNAANSVSGMAKDSKFSIAKEISSAEESIKSLSKSNKIVNGIGKVVGFTADHINPIICATGAVKVLTADDDEKIKIAFAEGAGIGGMLLGENLYKKAVGMPYSVKIDNKNVYIKDGKLYKLKNGKEELLANEGEFGLIKENKATVKRKGALNKYRFYNEGTNAIKDYCAVKKCLGKSLKWIPGGLKGSGMAIASITSFAVSNALGNKMYNFITSDAK